MKKRVKLFTTIASLCLAVALMAFGVYAAANVTYNVNGTVSYSMSDVLVEVTTTLQNATGFSGKNAVGTTVDALTTEGGAFTDVGTAQSFKTVNADGSKYDTDMTFEESDTAKTNGSVTHSVEYDLNESSIYILTISIKVHNDAGVTIKPEWIEPDAEAGYAVVTSLVNGTAATYAKQDDAHELKIAVVLRDATKSSIDANLNFKFTLAQA